MLDEPLGGMNPVERAATMDKVRRLAGSGITILLVEHDMQAVMGTCDTVTVMNAGQKIAEGPPEIVRNDQDVIDAYLGKEEIDA
jgi:branched-chain amino acid transport system ATP-binding protein